MPADGGKYRAIEKSAYAERLGREDEHTIEEINAAIEAITASPYRPEPKNAYKLLPPKDTTGGAEPLHLAVTVRRLQIVTNGFIVSYTVREFERLVCLEDLDLPFRYRIPGFQPKFQ